jgi:hypothetical protein
MGKLQKPIFYEQQACEGYFLTSPKIKLGRLKKCLKKLKNAAVSLVSAHRPRLRNTIEPVRLQLQMMEKSSNNPVSVSNK